MRSSNPKLVKELTRDLRKRLNYSLPVSQCWAISTFAVAGVYLRFFRQK